MWVKPSLCESSKTHPQVCSCLQRICKVLSGVQATFQQLKLHCARIVLKLSQSTQIQTELKQNYISEIQEQIVHCDSREAHIKNKTLKRFLILINLISLLIYF